MLLIKFGQEAYKDFTAEEACKLFGINFKKLKKAPEFVINPAKKTSKAGQSSEISVPAGTQFHAYFNATWEGKGIEIRYAEAVNKVEKADKYVDEYEPKKVAFLGSKMLIHDDNMDLVVYYMLSPKCKQSPFRTATSPAFVYMFKDVAAESQEALDRDDALVDALNAIRKYSTNTLRIVAKAFGITGTEGMEDVTVRRLLSDIAKNPHVGGPIEFNKTIKSQKHIFKGVIQNAIDSGVFEIKQGSTGKVWVWGKTDLRGKRVVEILETGASAAEFLINHILDDLETYYPILTNVHNSLEAEDKADKFFAKKNVDLTKLFDGATAPIDDPDDDDDDDNDDDNDLPDTPIGGNSDEFAEEPGVSDPNDDLNLGDDFFEEETKQQPASQVKDKIAEENAAAKTKTKPIGTPDFLKKVIEKQGAAKPKTK